MSTPPFEIREIYLDNAATARPRPEVVEEMSRVMAEAFGNASSRHSRGLLAAKKILGAEEALTSLVGAGPWKVIFTSGGTESNNLALCGYSPRGKRTKLVTTDLEHASITETAQALSARGVSFEEATGGLLGVVEPGAIFARVDDQTALVSVTHLSGEMGTIQPVAETAGGVKRLQKNCRFHTDAVQALPQLGRLSLCPEIDSVSISAHKIGGPQGVGALLCRPNALPRPLLFGGDQQQGIRPGTFNLPGIVGFGEAARLFSIEREAGISRMQRLCDRLIGEIVSRVEGAALLGDPAARAPGIAVMAFDNVVSEVLLHALEKRGVLASSSSACHSTRKDPPRCLVNAGLRRSQGAVRFSLSTQTTTKEVDGAIAAVSQAVAAFRSGRVGDL